MRRLIAQSAWARLVLSLGMTLGLAMLLPVFIIPLTMRPVGPADAGMSPVPLQPKLTLEQGVGEVREDRILLQQADDERFRLSSEPVHIRTDWYSILRLDLRGLTPEMRLSFWWRVGQSPKRVQSLGLARLTDDPVFRMDLSQQDGWTGQVIQLGLELRDPEGHGLEIRDWALEVGNGDHQLLALLDQFGWQERWSMRSINLTAGSDTPRSPRLIPGLAMLVLAWMLLYALLSLNLGRPPGRLLLLPLLAGWLLLDGRWLLTHARETLANLDPSQPLLDTDTAGPPFDDQLQAFAERLNQQLEPDHPLLIYAEGNRYEYLRKRLRYHLLPANVFNLATPLREHQLDAKDQLLLLGRTSDLVYRAELGRIEYGQPPRRMRVRELVRDPLGVLLQLLPNSDTNPPSLNQH